MAYPDDRKMFEAALEYGVSPLVAHDPPPARCPICDGVMIAGLCPAEKCPSIENDGHHEFKPYKASPAGWVARCRYCPAIVTSED